MSKVLLIGAILIFLGLGFWGYKTYQTKNAQNIPHSYQPTISNSLPKSSAAPTSSSNGLSNKQDVSNNALDKDFTDIQGNLNKLDVDQKNANTDSSTQDTPPAQ